MSTSDHQPHYMTEPPPVGRIFAADVSGDLIGKEIWDESATKGHWTNLKGNELTPWLERITPESRFVTESAPRWTTVTMVTHKKNRQVVIRTIVDGYLSEANLRFKPDSMIRYRSKA